MAIVIRAGLRSTGNPAMMTRPWPWVILGACLVLWSFPEAQAQPRFQPAPPTRMIPPGQRGFEPLPAARQINPYSTEEEEEAAEEDPTKDLPEFGREVKYLPTENASIEIIHRRSQLIVFKKNVTRIAVTDPAVADYVMYSPKEIGIIGGAIGTTTITVWFDNENEDIEPLIYLIKVVRDPSLDDVSRIDYGKLEKKIAVLFPNSKVYLIPMSGKIIVRGQARDSEEAAWILQIIRGEVINQWGMLGGPQPAFGYGINGLPNAAYGGGGVGGGQAIAGSGLNNGNRWGNDIASFNIINQLTIPGDFQLSMRVRIVELNRSRLRRMGVDFSYLIGNGQHFITTVMAGGAGTFSGVFDEEDVQVSVNALKSYGTAQILTEPNLTVMSGHDATVLSGGEFAVPTIVGVNGVGGQQTTFRGFGTSLVVTPTVIDKDQIRMRIRPEFSEINGSNSSGGVPGLNTRRVDTTVQLREGQTIVLAGLLSYRARTEIAAIPLLGGIPFIGPLAFQSKRANQDETELLVLVTPEIIRPMEADEVPPVPGFEVVHPDDHLLFMKAMSQGTNDTSVNQLSPYGNGSGVGVPIGYGHFNPNPASPMYSPAPGGVGAGGYSGAGMGMQPGGFSTPNNTPYNAGGNAYGTNGGGRYGAPASQMPPQGRPGMAPGGNLGSPASMPNGNGSGYAPPGPTAIRPSAATGQPNRSIPSLWRGPLFGRQQAPGTAPTQAPLQQAGYTQPR